ncbi:MAG: hypothetical protein Q6362_001455 [Candidatus Wukongarchaeota archaeon]|nr:hypothetical protein [Candidatus Wukongarchaeota archaeon]MDO8128100.1 hypothetical protein [Candidatus Wukongarchaeota archaeon]
MLHDLYVIKNSVCVFHKKIGGKYCVDADLVSGFLSAVETFSKELRDRIRVIEMERFKFVYEVSDLNGFIFVVQSDTEDDLEGIYKRLKSFKRYFEEEFDGEWDRWNGRLPPRARAEDLTQKWLGGETFRGKKEDFLQTFVPVARLRRRETLSPEEVKVLNYAFWRGRMRLTDLINDLRLHENLARGVANGLIEKGFLKREDVSESINT